MKYKSRLEGGAEAKRGFSIGHWPEWPLAFAISEPFAGICC